MHGKRSRSLSWSRRLPFIKWVDNDFFINDFSKIVDITEIDADSIENGPGAQIEESKAGRSGSSDGVDQRVLDGKDANRPGRTHPSRHHT